MSRYIDADVFMKKLKTNEYGNTDVNQIEIAISKSRADVVEARHAEWQLTHRDKDFYKDVYQCSECRFLVTGTQGVAYAYCPNCGARMDGKEQEHGTKDY